MPELVNSLLVNVVENTTPAYLNWYDDNTTWLNTIGNGVYFNPDMSYTFANAINMNLGMSDDWLGYFSFVNNMSHMAYDCRNLRGNPAVPPRVENMYRAFWNCVNLDKANVGPAVTNMTESFYHCNNIKTIDVGVADATNFADIVFRNEENFNDYTNLAKVTGLIVSGKVANMYRSFYNYPVLYAAPNCGLNVTNMVEAFCNTGVIGQPVIGNNVIDATRAYYNCPNVTGSVYTGKNTENIYQAFENCINLWGDVNIGNLVTNAANAFYGCKNLKGNISVGRSVVNLANTFFNCTGLTNYILTLNVDSIENMYYSFYNCYGLKGAPLSSKNATNMVYAYWNCRNITGEAYIGSKINNMAHAYEICYNLERINLPIDKATNIYNMTFAFDACISALGVGSVGANTNNAAFTYTGCRNLEEFYVDDDPNVRINMYEAYSGCTNAVGVAVARNGVMNNAYRGCNNIIAINLNRIGCMNIGNEMFYNSNTTNFSNVTDIYFSDIVTNTDRAFMNFVNLKGKVNHEVDGQMGNKMFWMESAFYQCRNLVGDAYVPESARFITTSYYNCVNIDGNVYFPSNMPNMWDARRAFENCHKAVGIFLNSPNSDNMYKFAFSSFYSDNNASVAHSATNFSNIEFIQVGDNVKTMIDFLDPVMYDGTTAANARMFAGYVTAGSNVTNMCRAFRGCNNLAKNAENKTANVGNKVVNLDATFQNCQYLENAQCPNSVLIATYSYYNCFNLIGNPAVGTGLKNTHNMYYQCRNLNGFIPEHFKYALLQNSVNMFFNCVNLNSEGNFIIPMSGNYYNMYGSCYNTNIRNLDIYGTEAGSHCITWRVFGSSEGVVKMATNNLRNVRFLSNVTNNYGPLGSGASRVFKLDWYAGMENLYVDIPLAGNFFPSDTGNTVDSVVQDIHWRSNNFVNLKKIEIGPNVTNMYNFARRIYASPTEYLKNLNVIDLNNATSLVNVQRAFQNVRAINNLTPFTLHGDYLSDSSVMFDNCINLHLNISECTFTDTTKPNITTYAMFYNCTNITGDPFCYNNANNTSQMFLECRNLTGNAVCSNVSLNTYRMYFNCNNIIGDGVCPSTTTNAYQMYYNCFNLTDNANTPNTGNMADMYYQCYNMTGTIVPNFVMSTSHNIKRMFYNCSQLTGPAYLPKGGSGGGEWWAVYYNCRNLNGIEMYNAMGTATYDLFGTMFAQDTSTTQPHIMNSDNLVYVNMYNTCGAYGDWGIFRYLNNVHDWYIDAPNAAGLFYKEYHASNGVGGDNNYMNRSMPRQAKGVSAIENIVIGPSVTSLAYFMLLADNINAGANKYGEVNIDISQAVNLVNMSNAFAWSDVNFGKMDFTHCTKLKNFMCAFERANYIRECNIVGCDNITDMQYAFGGCKNLTGHGYVPYNCTNLYQAYMYTNITSATIRQISGNRLLSFRGCNNLREINIQPSSTTTNAWGLADRMFGGFNDNWGAVKTLTNLANVTKIIISDNITDCAQMFRETNINCTPVFSRNTRNMYCSYYNCPNINANIGNIYIDYTGALSINCTFGGKLTPLVYGDVYLNTTATSGCDFGRGILIRNATTSRTSATPAFNWHWRRGSHWDIVMKGNWLAQKIGTTDTDSVVIAMDLVVDNGWHNTAYNIYIFNNYMG